MNSRPELPGANRIGRVEGIDPSDAPLLELRAAVYLISGRRRRAAGE